jgi:hypothetical protein
VSEVEAPEELLSLSTFVTRETVKIASPLHPDGRRYELRNSDELGILAHQRILDRQKMAEKLQSKGYDKLSPADATQLAEALDEIVNIVLQDLEPEVLAVLTDRQKAAIASAWAVVAERAMGLSAEGNDEEADQPTGAS